MTFVRLLPQLDEETVRCRHYDRVVHIECDCGECVAEPRVLYGLIAEHPDHA